MALEKSRTAADFATKAGSRHAGEPSKAALLRQQLYAPDLGFLMEAHNALSAKVVEGAGFRAIWASGLTLSSALGLRDCNEASHTQILEIVETMSDATGIPILLDGDTGYGNYNNVRLLVRKLCQKNIAGVCIEDKLFPKLNSFLGEHQPLADIDEFCGKIKAGKDAQTDADFSLVARIEALIAGYGLDEALRRAERYHEAGADAILIHSKVTSPAEVLAFAKEWDNRSPVLIVPTTYYTASTDCYRAAGISMVIWANHTLRAGLRAMREVCRRIHESETLVGVEENIASMRDLFAITGNDSLVEEERRYLSRADDGTHAIILAAGRGADLKELTSDRPKCMIDVRGQPLLRHLVAAFNDAGIRDIVVVRGYAKDAIDLPAIETVDNDDFAKTGEAYSLAVAGDRISGPCLIAFGDILFRAHLLDRVMETEGDIVLAVDALWLRRTDINPAAAGDLLLCSRPYTGNFLDAEPVSLVRIDAGVDRESAHGRWIGLARLSAEGSRLLSGELEEMNREGILASAQLADVLNRLVAKGIDVRVAYVAGDWLDVNTALDLASARNFV